MGNATTQVSTNDLLLCTSPGRFPPHSLAASSTITIPQDESAGEASTEEALMVVANLIKDRRHACSFPALAAAVQACNYIGAESVLNGNSL
jgi:hypothetical protein